MKKLVTLMLGMGLVFGTVSTALAQEKKEEKKEKKEKKKKEKEEKKG